MQREICTATGKQCYPTQRAAERGIKLLDRNLRITMGKDRQQHRPMRAYECTACGSWHYGHRPAQVRKAVAR